VWNSHVEDVCAAAGRYGHGGLTAKPLELQEGCEEGGLRPERFGSRFGVLQVVTRLRQPSRDRCFRLVETGDILPSIVVVIGVVRRFVVVGVVPARDHEQDVATLAGP